MCFYSPLTNFGAKLAWCVTIEDCHVPLESKHPQVKLVNDKGISFEMSYDEYFGI